MDSVDTFRQRLNWTRTWLSNFSRPTLANDTDNILQQEDECGEPAVLSVPCSALSSGFPLIDNDLSVGPIGNPADDVISLSSQDPATDCDDCSKKRSSAAPRPLIWCWVCQASHTATHRPIQWCWICQHCHGPNGKQIIWYPGDEHVDQDDSTPMTTTEGIDYELAGRQDDNTFRDLRSATKARKRKQFERSKYYGYKHVKPGQVNALHHTFEDEFTCCRTLCDCCEVASPPLTTMSKKQLYIEAQQWPRPPVYHRRSLEKEYYSWSLAFDRRQALWKHSDFRMAQAHEGRFDDVCSEGENSEIDCHEEWCDNQIDQRLYDYCDTCDVEWGRCRNYHIVEVDNVDEIVFETNRSRKA